MDGNFPTHYGREVTRDVVVMLVGGWVAGWLAGIRGSSPFTTNLYIRNTTVQCHHISFLAAAAAVAVGLVAAAAAAAACYDEAPRN